MEERRQFLVGSLADSLPRPMTDSLIHLDAEAILEVAEEVTEVDVEVPARLRDHDIVVVPVADTHHVRGHTVARARAGEEVDRLVVLLVRRVVWLMLLPRHWQHRCALRDRSVQRRRTLRKTAACL